MKGALPDSSLRPRLLPRPRRVPSDFLRYPRARLPIMIRTPILFLLLVSPALFAQTAPTKCQTGNDFVMGNVPVKTLVACADSFADDVLWHLDRVDQIGGELDGRAF